MRDGFRTIGVLGGMGPAATVDFLRKLLVASGATRDQDHPRIVVDCDPTLPDRHAGIAGTGPSPGPRLAQMARGLKRAGAELLAMPCNTAHAFEEEVRAATDLPFVSIVEAAVAETLARAPGARRVGLLAADGCLDARLYPRAFAARGVESSEIEGAARDRFMALVWRVKAGNLSAEVREGMAALAAQLRREGAEAIVAACTEVPLVLAEGDLDVPLIDSTAALARATVAAARRG